MLLYYLESVGLKSNINVFIMLWIIVYDVSCLKVCNGFGFLYVVVYWVFLISCCRDFCLEFIVFVFCWVLYKFDCVCL